MEVNNIISLENNKLYGLLLESEFNDNTYFLAVELDKEENPTNNFKVLKKIEENGATYSVEENDPLVLSELLEDFTIQADDED